MSTLAATWGEDVLDFKPERWLDNEGNLLPIPLAWQPFSKDESRIATVAQSASQILTHLTAPASDRLASLRPKNCIGMEFGLMEQKILLAMTVRLRRPDLRRRPSTKLRNHRYASLTLSTQARRRHTRSFA